MFKNNLYPPPPKKKSLSNVQTKCNKKMQHRLLSHIFDRIIISVPKYNYFGKPIKYNFIRVH